MTRAGDNAGDGADRFRTAMLTGEADVIADVLSGDVLFFSPAFSEPTSGRATVARVLATATQVYVGMRFDETLVAGSTAAVFFQADVDDQRLQACYRLTLSPDGLVERLDVLMRPVGATRALVAAMTRLTAPGSQG